MDIPILYEDNHLLIVEKPINIPVQEDRTKDEDLLTILKKFIKQRDEKPGNVYLSLIHRLDRPVGGAIVFAKTSKAASRLSDQLRRRTIERKYLAVVRGEIKQKEAKLVDYLWKDTKKNIVSIVSKHKHGAKQAILTYKVLETNKKLSLLEVELETGRPHQIRVQLNGTGHPLYGDQKYGQHVNKVGEQIALWAYELTLTHPTTKQVITVHSFPKETYPWSEWSYIKK
ncbi:RluA family pseudouridine synthase [Pseudogracilibacillus sp. ICA-222130]|uniref:RluA family pseudouridine synthase n=1 Tax=Pseudogracilibacillus sp. ICA-222130 TaxID=3134655 RepID=UPI0030C0E3E0